jgi:hypothetical protein
MSNPPLELVVTSRGTSLGPFTLGVVLEEVIVFLQRHGMELRNNEFIYNDAEPYSTDFCLKINDWGLNLRFDSVSQRLKFIDVTDFSKVSILYSGMRFAGPAGAPSLRFLSEIFGPSFPCSPSAEAGGYILQYPGVSFLFSSREELSPPDSKSSSRAPLREPPPSSATASRLFVYFGPELASRAVPPPLASDPFYFEEVHVRVGYGVWFSRRDKAITFDSSSQDVLTDLGPPSVTLSSPQTHSLYHPLSVPADLVYRYFSIGVDVTLASSSHRVKSIVLHTNLPGLPQFGLHRKCNFLLFPATLPTRASSFAQPACDNKDYDNNSHSDNNDISSNNLLGPVQRTETVHRVRADHTEPSSANVHASHSFHAAANAGGGGELLERGSDVVTGSTPTAQVCSDILRT